MTTNEVKAEIRVGAAYYPEQWPETRWETDAQMMERAGLKAVRLAEFAWHKFEPREGEFQFDWLERSIEVLSRHGVKAILCTPTPTYPAWLHRKFADIHQVKSDGQVKEFGQRQDACKNHPGYRAHARRITEEVTRHFGRHPEVIAWQTDNELGCHGTARCYCSHCERAFQEWLKKKFGDIRALNEAWGTAFWSQGYNDFSEISLPRDTADRSGIAGQNPGLVLDFFRFSSDVQIDFNRELAEIIRANSPSRPVTHNLMGSFTDIDYFRLAEDLDVVSWDNYPFFQSQTAHQPPAPLAHDLMRGLMGRNVWVMEQAAGPGGWDRFLPTPEPGRMRVWAYQAVAHGADYISFFRWRSARFGTEQYWHGILPHDGNAGARYAELSKLASEVSRLSREIAESRVRSDVAILYDYDSLWALQIQPHSQAGISYYDLARDYATALERMGITPDVISAKGDFSRYKVLIVPSQHVATKEFAARLGDYVQKGGVAIIGARSGVKNLENAVYEESLPAGLTEIAGCRVADYDTFSFLPSEPVWTVASDGKRIRALHLAEVLEPLWGAAPILSYSGRFYTGRPAAVRNKHGNGFAVYLGTFFDADGLQSVLRSPLTDAGVHLVDGIDPSIEIVARSTDSAVYRFYLNHENVPKTVHSVATGRDLLSNARIGDAFDIEALGVVVVRED